MAQITAAIRLIACTVAFGACSVTASGADDYPRQRSLDPNRETPQDERNKGVFDRDYYSRDPEIRNLLRTVEAYHMNPGLQKIKERRYQAAYEEFDFILRYYPNHPRALALMADVCLTMKRQEDGERYFKKALSLFPDMTRSAKGITEREYGKLLYRFGENARARDMLKQSVSHDDYSGEGHYYLGLAYLAEKDHDHANLHAQKAYAHKYPLTELRDKLMAANAWKPDASGKTASQK